MATRGWDMLVMENGDTRNGERRKIVDDPMPLCRKCVRRIDFAKVFMAPFFARFVVVWYLKVLEKQNRVAPSQN